MQSSTSPNEIVLLGAGKSILALSPEQRAYLNSLPVRIGLNKYAGFWQQAGISPTHVWFTDDHMPGPRILEDIIYRCIASGLRQLTVIAKFDALYQKHLSHNRLQFYSRRVKRQLSHVARQDKYRPLVLLPPGFDYRVENVLVQGWLTGGDWAVSTHQPLYQYRTSFTTVLNYISVSFPGSVVRLVGCDFNSPGYFFEDSLPKPWEDWTTNAQRNNGKHFAMLQYGDAEPVHQKFRFIRSMIDKHGVRLLSANPESEVVLHGLADYENVPVLGAETATPPRTRQAVQ